MKINTQKILIILGIIFIILVLGINIVSAENKESEQLAKAYIDYPTNQVSGNIIVSGWMMSTDKDANIKAFIDGNEVEVKSINREKRSDVIKAVKGYGTEKENPTPGMKMILNTEKLKEGKHVLSLKVFSKDNVLLTEEKQGIIYQKEKAQMYIDNPAEDNCKISSSSKIEGWIMSNDIESTIKVFVDDKEQEDIKIQRKERNDVIKAIKNCGSEFENPKPGFEFSLNMENIKEGKHTLKIKIYSSKNELLTEESKKIEIKKYNAQTYIDYPAGNKVSKNPIVEGWIMTDDEKSEIEFYIDGKKQEVKNLERTERSDVLKAIKGCGTEKENSKPGFKFDLNGIANGEHKINIKIVSREGVVLAEDNQKFVVENTNATMYVDSVGKDGKIEGWFKSNDKDAKLKAYIDGKEIEDLKYTRKERKDVLKVISGYGTEKENPKPGFEFNIDISKYSDGEHKIKISVVSADDKEITSEQVKMTIKKYNTQLYLDEPSYYVTNSKEIVISGWVMSSLAEKSIVVKFDDEILKDVTLKERPDVIKAIKGYGTEKENPKPGFSTKINVESYKKGEHKITIQVQANNTKEIIQEYTKKIVLGEKLERQVLTYGYSGAYLRKVSNESTLTCYKFGYGPNVLFATFCVHGFEDSWDRDGGVLLDIANSFYDRLLKDADQELAAKWTIYLFPEVNPDGRKLGTSNMGPGRRTLYSQAEKGIDINRSWQTGSEYQRFTDSRRYNGTKGFQAYEAAYLRDFMLTHKATEGQTVVIDLHGWEDQLIGDESICKYYKQQYTSCRTTGYGRYGEQYLISWARLNLNAKVALVELPYAANYQEVNKMKLSQKYIEATLNYLRGM